MSRIANNTFTLILAGIGCLITSILVLGYWHPGSGCFAALNGCSAAANSIYGHLGHVPTSLIGLAIYAAVLALCLRRHALLTLGKSRQSLTDAYVAFKYDSFRMALQSLWQSNALIFAIAALGSGFSVWLQKVALFDLRFVCPWCMASTLMIALICAIGTRDLVTNNRRSSAEQRYLAGGAAIILVAGVLLFGLDPLLRQIGLDLEPRIEVSTAPSVRADNDIVRANMHTIGPTNARYTIVAFLDYECPQCKQVDEMMKTAMLRCPGKYRFAIRHDLMPNHRWAAQAARAAEAAGVQGKFWAMSDLLFAHQDDMNHSNFTRDHFARFAAGLWNDSRARGSSEQSMEIN